MTMFRRFADKGLVPALTAFLVSLALFAVTAAPLWAQRTYDRLPVVKEGTTVSRVIWGQTRLYSVVATTILRRNDIP